MVWGPTKLARGDVNGYVRARVCVCARPQALFVLFESASGFAMFEVVEAEAVGGLQEEVQRSVKDLARFSQVRS